MTYLENYKIKNMKNLLFIFIAVLGGALTTNAQYTTVTFDFDKSYFGENQPLPAERSMMFSGAIPSEINMVEVSIFSYKGKDSRRPLYTNLWRQAKDGNAKVFNLPMNQKLRASTKYDIEITYFKAVSESERMVLNERLTEKLHSFIDFSLTDGKKGIKLIKSEKKMVKAMNEMVQKDMQHYRNAVQVPYVGFSELVAMKLKQIKSTSIKVEKAKAETKAERKSIENAAKSQLRQNLINELKELVSKETADITAGDWSVIADSRYVDNYETEGKQSSFAVNFGYGGVYLSGKVSDNLTYGNSPYLGLSFPLGNTTFAPKILSNSSITLGAFVNNFKDENNNVVTGPVFGRPIYLGLDYKLFQFVRFNAGATLLEGMKATDELNTDFTKTVYVRPFIGVSAKINLAIGLDR